MIAPDAAAFAAAYAAGRPQVVWTRIVADTETPVSAMLKLGLDGRGGFLLESVEGGAVRGRYSLLGLAPDLVWRANGHACEANPRFQDDPDAFEPCGGATLEELRKLVASIRMELPEALPSALSLLVGYMGYETAALVEKLPAPKADPLGVPDMLFMRPTLLLVFDRLKDELFIVAPAFPDGTTDADTAYAEARERIETAAAKLTRPVPAERAIAEAIDVTPKAQTSPTAYASMVDRAKEYILAGDIFQVVLAQRFAVDFPLPPFDLYRALRRINPSPFLYFLDLPGFALTGSSPEILVRVRDGEVTIRPIAGTRPRGATGAEDAANRDSLLADPKELSEHLMLLDLGRNDIGRVAKPGTVAVTERNMVEFYSHVMHIVSNVRADLSDDKDTIDALLAGFPAGTVSGAPKVRAMEIIHELEAEKRGAYAGGVGYFAADGSMDSCIVLRTAVVKDGTMHVQAGAGIVADSEAAYEQRECEAKAGALMAAALEAIRMASEPRFGQ
ncbi:anthranilate synthase component I [Sphingoaurantiacus capsulatus]|uniref:Anthranilate synthase component 1 n=1 Tax=Sphingoaurantiacus capsulatus TaxID=1771310 RepID=A0ABV7XF32_9SPHN